MKIGYAKKTISISLVVSLLVAPLSAVAEDRIFGTDIMSNTTPAKTWEDKTTGIKYHSGKKGIYKFKRETYFAPWLTVSPPKAAITCSGFSFDLGFVGIMNIEGIEDQLSEATQAIMWGLLTAFKLSTPNLSAVFEYINKIIRQIQDILANACTSGREFAKGLNGGKEIDAFGWADSQLGTANTSMKTMNEEFQKGRKNLFEKAIEKIGSLGPKEKAKQFADISSTEDFNRIINVKLLNNPLRALLDDIDLSTVLSNVAHPGVLSNQQLKKIIEDKMIKYNDGIEKTIPLTAAKIEQNKRVMILADTFFGSTILSSNDSEKIREWSFLYSQSFENIIASIKNDEKRSSPSNFELTEPTINYPDVIGNFNTLVKGPETNSTQAFCMKDYYVYFLATPKRVSKDDENITVKEAEAGFIIANEPNVIEPTLCLKWSGAESSSETGVLYLISHILNRPVSKSNNNIIISPNYGKNSVPEETIEPLVVDTSMDDLRTIAQYIRTKKFSMDDRAKKAINFLIEENAKALSIAVVNLAYQANRMSTGKNKITKDAKANQLSATLFEAYIKLINDHFTENSEFDKLVKEMREIIAGSNEDKIR